VTGYELNGLGRFPVRELKFSFHHIYRTNCSGRYPASNAIGTGDKYVAIK
jgi:hypothetical protein